MSYQANWKTNISHALEGQKSKIKAQAQADWMSAKSLLPRPNLLSVVPQVGKGERTLWNLFSKGTLIVLRRAQPSWSPFQTPVPDATTLGYHTDIGTTATLFFSLPFMYQVLYMQRVTSTTASQLEFTSLFYWRGNEGLETAVLHVTQVRLGGNLVYWAPNLQSLQHCPASLHDFILFFHSTVEQTSSLSF